MMLDWLLLPIDPTRGHDLSLAIAWHGRVMVFAWGLLLPTGIIIARFFKITPRQSWPTKTDNKVWWVSHLGLQYAGVILTLAALYLIWQSPGSRGWHTHTTLGWLVVAAVACQIIGGWLRGSKGGPAAPALDGSLRGDHYDMSPRRRLFEGVHKSIGYVALGLSVFAIVSGLTFVNAQRWMFAVCVVWWVVLGVIWVRLQRRGFALDTYQAIWGPDPKHPGNRRLTVGWGMRRPDLVPHAKDGRDNKS
jgi:hypothetical protein